MEFKDRLKELIDERAITVYKLSMELDCKQSTIWEWIKRGSKPNNKFIDALCSYFGVNKEWLIEGKGDKYIAKENLISQETNLRLMTILIVDMDRRLNQHENRIKVLEDCYKKLCEDLGKEKAG